MKTLHDVMALEQNHDKDQQRKNKLFVNKYIYKSLNMLFAYHLM